MKSILEIPVFGEDEEIAEFFSTQNNLIEKKYHDFTLLDFSLDDKTSVFLYLLTFVPEIGHDSLLDQVISKAPFSLIIVDEEEGIQWNKTGDLYTDYQNNYETPLFFLMKSESNSDDKVEVKNILDDKEVPVVIFDRKNPRSINKCLYEAIQQITPE